MADLVFPDDSATSISSLPTSVDLKLYKGDYVELFVTVKNAQGAPVDLTGSTPSASLKKTFTDSSPLSFTCTLTGTTGEVRILLPTSVSTNLVPGDYIWDFQITNAQGNAKTYLAGDVAVFNEVTA